MTTIAQRQLGQQQIAKFRKDKFVTVQVEHFHGLMRSLKVDGTVVDMGGGCGHFAHGLTEFGFKTRVVDTDEKSVQLARERYQQIDAVVGDALAPAPAGDEAVVCFNLMLHHLVADTDAKTLELQKRALEAWKGRADYLFVNEYIYESYLPGFTGRLVYEITSNKVLSAVGKVLSKPRVMRFLRANTFGVGVRFRSHEEWLQVFDELGFEVVATTRGEPEPVQKTRRLLLLRHLSRDSFLLRARA